MKTIVVYYSMSGNTDHAARAIAERLDAQLLRIEPEKAFPDSGFRKYFRGGKSAVMAETTALRPYEFCAEDLDRIVLGFPVWAGSIAPPLRTFLRDNAAALSGKRVAAFACQSGSGAEKAFSRLEGLLGSALFARLVLIDPLKRPRAENDEKLRLFCEECERDG